VKNAGVLFDVDGVLLDSIGAYRRAWRIWGAEHRVGEDDIWAVAHGRRPVDIIRLSAPDVEKDAGLRRFEVLIAAEYGQVPAMPGARDLLERLSVAWAVVTSGSRATVDRAFRRLDLPVPHAGVYDSDVTLGKPDPACYRLAAQRLGLDPRACVVVEDAPSGVAAGKAAGMTVIAVTTTHAECELKDADHVVRGLPEVADALF
jgi:mannitol-1-/sugar-/sorbitol-6-phosphatase